jgi:hypothetical protein
MQDTITMRLCGPCGKPASYSSDQDGWDLCDECAREYGAEMNGYADAAIQMMAKAVGMLREDARFTDAQIGRVFEGVMRPGIDLCAYGDRADLFGVGTAVLGRDGRADRRWARMYTPISEGMAA